MTRVSSRLAPPAVAALSASLARSILLAECAVDTLALDGTLSELVERVQEAHGQLLDVLAALDAARREEA